MPQSVPQAPLTADDVHRIVGPADGVVVTRIIETGATAAELLEAYQWLFADDHVPAETRRPMSARVRELYELLEAELPEVEDRR